ncbi:MAG TPA: hypothetical protein VE153_34470, partial [Myxococcus sp.]|nr:hypothetical protein [Myxococcus sp.]
MRHVLVGLWVLSAGCARNARPTEELPAAEASAKAAAAEAEELKAPRYEHIFMMPVERALAEATKLLKDEGWVLHPMEDPKYLLTEWRTAELGRPGWGWKSDGDSIRYLVAGEPMGHRQSIIRIFRMKRTFFSNDAEVLYDRNGSIVQKHMLMTQMEQRFRQRGAPRDLASNPMQDTVAWDEGNNVINDTAPWVETEGAAQGTRDLELEQQLLLRIEQRPSLETLTGTLRLTRDDAFARDPSFYLKRWRQPPHEACTRSVDGFQPLLRAGATVLIGEQPGTWESPNAVGALACDAAGTGLAVTVGLSIPQTEQKRIEAYLASRGAPPDQDALLKGDFWRKVQQDGRGSRAVMDLIDRMRALRAAGRKVSVVAFDTDMSHGSVRDEKMAKLLLAQRAARPYDVFLVLAGNAHTRLESGWNDDFVPMSKHLAQADPAVKVLELGYAQGRRWGCDLAPDNSVECDILGITPDPRVTVAADAGPVIRLLPEVDDEGFHGFLDVGALSASLPAVAL